MVWLALSLFILLILSVALVNSGRSRGCLGIGQDVSTTPTTPTTVLAEPDIVCGGDMLTGIAIGFAYTLIFPALAFAGKYYYFQYIIPGVVFLAAYYFLIGVIVGWIYSKIKNRNRLRVSN